MTRINAGVHPSELCDQHLRGELHEIVRIPKLALRYAERMATHLRAVHTTGTRARGPAPIPHAFQLGEGSVKFFYNKGAYIIGRQGLLVEEFEHRFQRSYEGWRIGTQDWPTGPIEMSYSWDESIPGCPPVPARHVLLPRIIESMREFASRPKWTARSVPDWVPSDLPTVSA